MRSACSGNSLLSSSNGFIKIGTKTGDVGKFFFFRWHLAKATTSILVLVLLQNIFDLIRLSRRVHRTYLIIYELCFTCFKVEYRSSCIFQSSSNETVVEI